MVIKKIRVVFLISLAHKKHVSIFNRFIQIHVFMYGCVKLKALWAKHSSDSFNSTHANLQKIILKQLIVLNTQHFHSINNIFTIFTKMNQKYVRCWP